MKKILFLHIASLALMSSVSLYIVFQEYKGSYSEFFLPSLKLYGGFFFAGALVLGMGGVLRPILTISMHFLRGNDLNRSQFRGQIQKLIVFVAEMYIALVVLFLTGFVGIKF